MVPGDTSQKYVTVTYQESVENPDGVKVYSGSYVDSGDFDMTHTNYATGAGVW